MNNLCGVVQPRAWMCDPVQSFFSFRDFVWVGRVGCSNRVPCRPSLKLDRTGLRQFLILYQVCNIFVQPLKSAPSKCKLCKQMRRRSRMTGQFLQYSFLSNFFYPFRICKKSSAPSMCKYFDLLLYFKQESILLLILSVFNKLSTLSAPSTINFFLQISTCLI